MRTTSPWIHCIGVCLALAATCAFAGENKWRLQVSGGAESDGRIVLMLTPDSGEPMRVSVDVPKGRGEHDIARDLRDAIAAQASARYHVEVDDGEDVLVKKKNDTPKFDVTIVENTVQGVRVNRDKE